MQLHPSVEHIALLILVFAVSYLLRLRYHERQEQPKKEDKKKTKPRQWRPKSPSDCPACQSGLQLSIQPIQREVKPWTEYKSSRGRKKQIRTQGHACPYPNCRYFGITDEAVYALVGNGKRGRQGPYRAKI